MKIVENYNPYMQVLARNFRLFTQTQLSNQTKIPQSIISKLETGVQKPLVEQVEIIAEILEFPSSFFTREGRIYSNITPFHRKKTSLTKKYLNQSEAIGNMIRLNIKELIDQTDIEFQCQIPRFEVSHFEKYGGAAGIAIAIRSYFNLPKGPIDSMIDFLESNGAVVTYVTRMPDKLDGFTLMLDDNLPLVISNPNFQGEKIRMTHAHELAHIVMHRVFHDNCEEEAWDFAAEFLMPKNEIKHEFPKKLTKVSDLIPLKIRWKVSVSALVMRAYRLDLITERTMRYLYMQLSQYGKAEPIPIPKEQPRFINALISHFRENLDYSPTDLASFLGLSLDTFSEFYMGKKAPLFTFI